MLNLNIPQIKYLYQAPQAPQASISFGKGQKSNQVTLDPEVKAFYANPKEYKKEQGTISCAPLEVQEFYKEAKPDINEAKKNLYMLKLNEKTICNKIIKDVEDIFKIAKSGKYPENAKFEKTDNGFIYKEYNGRYITREIIKTDKKIKFTKAEGNNKKTITVCDVITDKTTGKIMVTNIKHTTGYHKTGLGAISYDKEYIFEKNKLKEYRQNYMFDERGNSTIALSVDTSQKGSACIVNKKIIANEGIFCDKIAFFDGNGIATRFTKNLVCDPSGIRTTEKEIFFENNQPVKYILEGYKNGNIEENQRYAQFSGLNWYYM